MRTPFSSLLAAALIFTAAPALAHDGAGAADDGGAINCPMVHSAPAHHHVAAHHHARRSGGCPTMAAHDEHHRMAFAGGENEYGRHNFSWAPTGPGDEHPGPSTWRPGAPAQGLYGAPPTPPAGAYAQRGYDQRGSDQRDRDQRAYAQRGDEQRSGDRRDQGEREFSDQFRSGDRYARSGGNDSSGWTIYPPARRGAGERDSEHRLDERGLAERGMTGREYAYGYSREEERSWSSRDGGASVEHRASCDCDGRASTTDRYGYLTWPGKTHFQHGQIVGEASGGAGPAPWADAPQAPIIVRP